MPNFQIGSYWGRLISAIMEEVGDNQTPCLTLKFDVTHNAVNGEWVKLANPEQRPVKLFMSEKAWPYTEEKLLRFGFNGDFANPDFSAEFKAGAELVCKHKESNGKWYDEFEFPMVNAEKPASADTVRTWNSRWKSTAGAAAKPAGAPPAAPVHRVIRAGKPPSDPAPQPVADASPAPAIDGNEPPF